MIKPLPILSFLCVLISACNTHTYVPVTTPNEYFGGTLSYYPAVDSAVFHDCATGIRHQISHHGAYRNTVNGAAEYGRAEGEPLFIEFRGSFIGQVCSEQRTKGLMYTVRIDSLMGFNELLECNRQFVLPGIYRSGTHQIILKPDYYFSEIIFHHEDSVTENSGRWYLNSRDIVMLVYDLGDSVVKECPKIKFTIDNYDHSLVEFREKEKFGKVYLR